MKIIKTSQAPIKETPHKVEVRGLYSFPHASFVYIKLLPGETLKKHITPVDATFYILEGKGKVEIGEEIETVEKGDLIFSPLKIVHRLFNDTDQEFAFLVMKTPTPVNQETKIL
jgi:quercetin dioxygenase-like cupin family protein